jgi:arylsulfatase A-like enzyme
MGCRRVGRHPAGKDIPVKKKNIIMISFDEVRPDHLGCYGYGKNTTPNVDRIAENGVLFENCIAAGCFTPICMSSVLTGCYPNKHTVRDPYCTIQRPTIAEILKGNGYLTAGFSGNGVLGSAHGFGKGFASYDEPDDREGRHFDTAATGGWTGSTSGWARTTASGRSSSGATSTTRTAAARSPCSRGAS